MESRILFINFDDMQEKRMVFISLNSQAKKQLEIAGQRTLSNAAQYHDSQLKHNVKPSA